MSQTKDFVLISLIAIISLLTVVYAAPAAGQNGVSTLSTGGAQISQCQAGFYRPGTLTNNSCLICGAGSYTAADNQATACTSCEAGNYCPQATVSTGATTGATKTACPAGSFCAAGVAAPTPCTGTGAYCAAAATALGYCTAGNFCPDAATQSTCPVGHYCTASLAAAIPCASGQVITGTGNDAASDCVAFTGTAIANCLVYDGTASLCAIPKDGYFLGGAAPHGTLTQCLANCGKCTGSTYALCTEAKAGFFKDATTSTIIACAAGCKTCTAAAATSCTIAMAGNYIDATAGVKACAAGTGVAEGANAGAAVCTACNAAASGLCGNCKAPGFCTTCKPGNVLTADTGVCAAFGGTKDVTCLLAEGSTNADCNTCDATKFRQIEQETIAPATTPTDKAKGKCMCMEGYAEQATVVAACKKCSDNVKACTFNATGVETVTECATGFHKIGNACKAANLSGTDVTGFFWDTTGTTSKYTACNAKCRTCSGAAATNCVLCPERPTTWAAPTDEAAANYKTYLKLITQINGTCYEDCPATWEANQNRDSCVAADESSTTGLYAIISVIFSLFLLL